ncbi:MULTISPECIES: DUF2589 domain-containing protein [Sphingobacterium]|uniref:DUF2589 domain-containing protein n=1 Tax=Sphingobacterium TaxID=28453 RepID=UPI0019194083|nr:DUF2589 domain-containing protein [Sphingobacterium multivorum]QQT31825.1 DUF2589 domain-containing protein [Sphingobacterium multivorum]
MAIDTTPSTVATNALQALPFSSLIGGPLDAAIKAQAMAAKTSWEFIQQVGLNENPQTGKKEAINVTFFYNKNGQMTKLIVPLLTIVPIPYIAIDTIDINFTANISAASSSVSETSESTAFDAGGSAKASFGIGPFSVSAEFKANYSSKKDSKASQDSKYSVEYTMNVAVHAGQSDMPAGLATVLNILQSSITDANDKGTFVITPVPQIDISKYKNGESISIPISATIKNADGLLLANEVVNLSLVDPVTGIEFTDPGAGKSIQATTNEQGQAVWEIKATIKQATEIKGVSKFILKDDKQGLSADGILRFEGTPAT